MHRLYGGLWQENVQLTIHSSPSWSVSCFFLCVFFSNKQRCWRSDGGWLTEGEGVVAPPFYIDYCHFIRRCALPWPFEWEDCSYFWIWPAWRNLATFLLQGRIIISSCLGLASWRANTDFGRMRGWRNAISKHRVEGLPPDVILLFLSTFKWIIFSLFSLKSFNISPILMTDLLLLHILLHPLTHDAVWTVRPLTLYSTKNSNRGTIANQHINVAKWLNNWATKMHQD